MNRRQLATLSEDILLMLYERTATYGHESWDFISAFTAQGKEAEKQYADEVLGRLVARGWLVTKKSLRLQGSSLVRVTDRGTEAALRILDQRAPKSFRERVRQISRSDRIAIAAFIVSLVALFK